MLVATSSCCVTGRGNDKPAEVQIMAQHKTGGIATTAHQLHVYAALKNARPMHSNAAQCEGDASNMQPQRITAGYMVAAARCQGCDCHAWQSLGYKHRSFCNAASACEEPEAAHTVSQSLGPNTLVLYMQ
jgi:hypothetical protein